LRKKNVPQQKPTWTEERKRKVDLSSPPSFSPGTGRDEKGAPIDASSIHIGALVGAGSLWADNRSRYQWLFYKWLFGFL
jgi:hypothetical protein